jgi:sugar lactone lactonase YvrE
MLAGPDGRIYSAAFEKNAIVRFDPETGKTETVFADAALQWPDSLSWGPDGELYITTSQIHRTPKFNQGESKLKGPFMVYRLRGL